MRSGPRGGAPLDDLTARARIRDAALELFGDHGYSGTSIRDVAARAGVSAGLVQHHFGSKAGLREACDAYALHVLRVNAQREVDREVYDADFVSQLYEATRPVLKFVARGWAEGWASSAELFDMYVETTTQWLTKVWPERFPAGSRHLLRHAATMVSMSLGAIVLHEHVARWLGADPLDVDEQHRTWQATLEVYATMGEYITSERGRHIREAMAEFARRMDAADDTHGGGRAGGGGE